MMQRLWAIRLGDSPLVATAIHKGHEMRAEIGRRIRLDDQERRREEDPFTAVWTSVAPTGVVVHRSRFEVDVNRPRDKAVYVEPEDAWGLQLWREPLSPDIVARSLAEYDEFYAVMRRLLTQIEQRFGRFIVFDLHTYNHRRGGPDAPPADPERYPEINLGTGTMQRSRWERLVERFLAEARGFDFLGRHLDVRENVCFRGGNFPAWVHSTFPETGCALAIEVKKFFMDEWTGEPDPVQLEQVRRLLKHVAAAVLEEAVLEETEQSWTPHLVH